MNAKLKITKEEREEHKAWLREQKILDKTTPKLKPSKGVIV